MTFYAETKMENYEAAIGLVKEALFNVEFSSDRAKTIISKYMNRYTVTHCGWGHAHHSVWYFR